MNVNEAKRVLKSKGYTVKKSMYGDAYGVKDNACTAYPLVRYMDRTELLQFAERMVK